MIYLTTLLLLQAILTKPRMAGWRMDGKL